MNISIICGKGDIELVKGETFLIEQNIKPFYFLKTPFINQFSVFTYVT